MSETVYHRDSELKDVMLKVSDIMKTKGTRTTQYSPQWNLTGFTFSHEIDPEGEETFHLFHGSEGWDVILYTAGHFIEEKYGETHSVWMLHTDKETFLKRIETLMEV